MSSFQRYFEGRAVVMYCIQIPKAQNCEIYSLGPAMRLDQVMRLEIVLKYNTNYGIMSSLHKLLYQISESVKQRTSYKGVVEE